MLEGLAVESFVLVVEGDDFVVRGQRREAPLKKPEVKTFRVLWQIVRGKQADPETAAVPASSVLELRYTAEDVAKMEEAGREKRAAPSGTPEAHSLPQIFRALGDFVDQKQGRLLAIRKEGEAISVDYESPLKGKVSEELTVSALYDYWVRMYLKRRGRTATPG
jgi:hypothetical protein